MTDRRKAPLHAPLCDQPVLLAGMATQSRHILEGTARNEFRVMT